MFKDNIYSPPELLEAIRYKANLTNFDINIDYYIKQPVKELMHCKHFVPRWSCHGHKNEYMYIKRKNKYKLVKRFSGVSYIIFVADKRGVDLLSELFIILNNGNSIGAEMKFLYLTNSERNIKESNLHIKISLLNGVSLYKGNPETEAAWLDAIHKLKENNPNDFY